ncbi:MAG: DUF642 domain-containing protein [Candidatus Promineifilaceae bacterium]|nr:DUF642 domain-containing protein [Candidatus Promineifilaceae bacterium]
MSKVRLFTIFLFVVVLMITFANVGPDGINTAVAAPTNLVLNGSFEQGVVSNCGWATVGPGNTFITGWTVTGGNVDLHRANNCSLPWGVPDGRQGVDLNAYGRGLYQDVATTAGQQYQLSFWMAGNDCEETIKSIDVWFGGTVVDNVQWSRSGKVIFNPAHWEYHSYEVTATSSVSQLAFVSTTVARNPDWCGPAIDAVELVELNAEPSAAAGGPYLVAVGEQVTFDGSGSSDPDGDPLTESWTAGGGTVVGNVYTADAVPGIYDVVLVVNDGTVDSAPDNTLVVVYDPSGGFVTGGGWIDSPSGAYTPDNPDDEDVTGKASFGFVSKYKKGASVPTGNTEFQFKAGDLNFHSDSYQWLVINQGGTNAQYKGEGTINGDLAPNGEAYVFMLWAGDGDPGGDDTFRIRIWYEEGDNENVVYDNGFDQVIGGGNIKVHKK